MAVLHLSREGSSAHESNETGRRIELQILMTALPEPSRAAYTS
eukprot:CAMPEP_0184401016 /NCGR_PEP_ID=MMETSP0007-20130409/77260_1 /TAXON_ID=97485 /ORGANISM="Prymnesium parvum, Strain Texoma1" /LENGTH=42 /DNA_ID= /DNA_START= /DNA_END= /DNA_ORIENTATION=